MRPASRCPLAVIASLVVAPLLAQEPAAKVTLPLGDYLKLVEQVRAAEEGQARALESAEPRVAEVVEQSTGIRVVDDTAELEYRFRVEIRGEPVATVELPLTGLVWEAEVEGAALAAGAGGITLVPSAPGHYTVTARTTARLSDDGGVLRLDLAPVVAPVAVTAADLPADLAWSCPGAVVDQETVSAGRRQLRMATARHQQASLELRREVSGGEAERTLARAVVVAVVRLGSDRVLRHDVVLYEVSRGSLSRLEVELPAGLELEALASDEGDLPPLAEAGRVSVQREARLSGTGHLLLTSRPAPGQIVDLAPVLPAVEVRARYLAVAASVAAEASPRPAERWLRVDLGDLPAAVSAAAQELDLVAAWRWQGEPGPATVAVTSLPPAQALETVVRRRDTTTLLTVEGTLLHRDRLVLSSHGSGLGLLLPEGATLWSTAVNGLPVRTVERNGRPEVPLPLGGEQEVTVEAVVVQERAIPPGRSRISLEPPELAAPVLTHGWRLILPESNRYRYAAGSLRPVPPEPSLPADAEYFAEAITVSAEAPVVDSSRVGSGQTFGSEGPRSGGGAPAPRRKDQAEADQLVAQQQAADAKLELRTLRQGLVGGVRPVPVTIPEAGKSLLLEGALPPPAVSVELEVKAARER